MRNTAQNISFQAPKKPPYLAKGTREANSTFGSGWHAMNKLTMAVRCGRMSGTWPSASQHHTPCSPTPWVPEAYGPWRQRTCVRLSQEKWWEKYELHFVKWRKDDDLCWKRNRSGVSRGIVKLIYSLKSFHWGRGRGWNELSVDGDVWGSVGVRAHGEKRRRGGWRPAPRAPSTSCVAPKKDCFSEVSLTQNTKQLTPDFKEQSRFKRKGLNSLFSTSTFHHLWREHCFFSSSFFWLPLISLSWLM